MMTQFRMRCDYLDATQWISELRRLISGSFSEEIRLSHVFCGKRVMGDRQDRQAGRAQNMWGERARETEGGEREREGGKNKDWMC